MAELRRWQPTLNLVSPASLPHLWDRHIADCLQLADLAPSCDDWVDLGSGAGLPGLIIAASDRAPRVTLVESDGRKCAFLRQTAQRMGLLVCVLEGRIESVCQGVVEASVVTARGLAPLKRLLAYAQPLLGRGTICLFPKGKTYDVELTEARECWTFSVDIIPSRTDSEGRILRISELVAKS